MPKNPDINKVLVLSSSPIIIRQAVELDYMGTRARRSLKEKGMGVVLLDSNPATVMTDKDIADRIHIEPLTVEVMEQLTLKEKPDSVLPALDGQAGLSLAMGLESAGFFKKYNMRLIGTTVLTIKKAEDREMFKETMEKIGKPAAPSDIVEGVKRDLGIVKQIGHPVVLHPTYTLGDSGGGVAQNPEQCARILEDGLRLSRVGQVLVEHCIADWKETGYEVMRDSAGNVITVYNTKNIDPVGAHTDDNIVVTPSQALGDGEYQMLRTSAFNIISRSGITSDCNAQCALSSDSFEYCVIEADPRVSRPSALVSKATRYSITRVAAKIALSYALDKIRNAVTRKVYASSEPMPGCCMVKMPRLPFDRFVSAKRTLEIQMKATGEVMSICTDLEGGLMKAICSPEQHVDCLLSYDFIGLTDSEPREQMEKVDDMRIWRIAGALRRDISYEETHAITKVDVWSIDKLAIFVETENAPEAVGEGKSELTAELLKEVKRVEFPDNVIARLTGISREEVKEQRYENDIRTAYKVADTCTTEFATEAPYHYSCSGSFNETEKTKDHKKVLILGSGPIRIGQGIEFNFCSVYSTWTFSRGGYKTIIVDNNPKAVSTDSDIADKPYFEPLTPEDVESIVDIRKPDGTVVQFGGQTAIKLTEALMKMGVPILNTAIEGVDTAEDRELFDTILEQCNIPRPAGRTVFTAEEAGAMAHELGYPMLMRPSYALGGQDMQIAISDEGIDKLIGIINMIAQERPILVDKYIIGKEVEADVIRDGTDILIPDIMGHVERTGIHSGDSTSVYPAMDITQHNIDTIVGYTGRLAKTLRIRGMINVQFVMSGDNVYTIEVNPRSSCTVPYVNKVTEISIIPLATQIVRGRTVRELGYKPGLQPMADYAATKMPVFSLEKIRGADIGLEPEMKSTGEYLDIARTFNRALYKTFEEAGVRLPKYKKMIMTIHHSDQEEAADIVRRFAAIGYRIFTTRGTAGILNRNGVKAYEIRKLEQESPNTLNLILGRQIDLIIGIPAQGVERSHDGFIIHHNAVETGINMLTSLDTTAALVTSLENRVGEFTLVDIAMAKNTQE